MRKILHRIAHMFNLNGGYAESHYEGIVLVTCFKCSGCGELSDCYNKVD